VREEVAYGIHYLDCSLRIRNAHVDVETEGLLSSPFSNDLNRKAIPRAEVCALTHIPEVVISVSVSFTMTTNKGGMRGRFGPARRGVKQELCD
jgi:hypothetical protein